MTRRCPAVFLRVTLGTLLLAKALPAAFRPAGGHEGRDEGPLRGLRAHEHHAGGAVPQQLLGGPGPRRPRRRRPPRPLQRRRPPRPPPPRRALRLLRGPSPEHLPPA